MSLSSQPNEAWLISQARSLARDSGRNIIDALVEQTGESPAQCVERLASYLGLPRLSMQELRAADAVFDAWAFAEATAAKAIVLRHDDRLLGVLLDPFDVDLQLTIESAVGQPLTWALTLPADFDAYLLHCEAGMRAMSGVEVPLGVAPTQGIADISMLTLADDQSPIVRMVNSAIYDGLKLGASDIHVETTSHGLSIKVRVDGVLSQMLGVPGIDVADQVVSRIKVMADLDIGERRVPQDGRFKLAVRGREIDFRVSVMPSLFGEDVVIRILDRQRLTDQVKSLSLDVLGFDARTLSQIRQLATEPYGMVLVTGPTGSGKTTTLYAAISEIHTGEEKIITIEDPIEYQLPGVLQIPVNEKKGLSFARGLRSILRHDPDKILVGEIRDSETAQIAIQSALTGHLVFTSVHANNVFDVIGRFLHMGVDPYSFVAALNGVVGQRLLRVICTDCAVPVQLPDERLVRAGIHPEHAAEMNFMNGQGCGACRGTGYRGRVAIGEVLLVDDTLRELIAARAPISSIKQAAVSRGTRFLRDAAVELLAVGRTTLEEINRVTFAS